MEKDRDGARELQRRHIMGTPFTLIGSNGVVGFDQAKIDKILRIKK